MYQDSSRVEQMLKSENDRLKDDIKLIQHRALKEVNSSQKEAERQQEHLTRKH